MDPVQQPTSSSPIQTPIQPTPPISEPQAPVSAHPAKMPLYIGVGLILLILVAGGGYLVFAKPSNNTSQITQQTIVTTTPRPTQQLTPAVSPVTTANADETLNNTDSAIQKTMNQANTDLNDLNNVNTSQDNTSGL